ncbi:MAG: TetM/TetW/TetO/TetS family tetracycline resistance ribosomal protection protein [Clostridia bacterium]|nr:TetM/TetW/TetO/TetS family tetracycline resistance ribosomal protection protein [Clostridia bacterium]
MKKITAGIVAHVDAGKTTLAEEMLFRNGVIRTKGRVDHGDTFFDSEEIERERGITVFSSCSRFTLKDTEITILDTPGHVDFSSETERVFSVADLVIMVISSAEGVEAHTRTLWSLAKSYSLPVFVFVTKCDLERRSRAEIMSELTKEFGNCVDMERRDGIYTSAEKIAETNEETLEEFISDGAVSDGAIARAIKARELFPVFFGAALRGVGVDELTDALDRLTLEREYYDEFAARVYKISRDKGSRAAHIRITGGSLKVKDTVMTGAGEEKIDSIKLCSGARSVSVNEAFCGDVCAVTGLSAVMPGDALGAERQTVKPRLEPVMRYRLLLPDDMPVEVFLPKLRSLAEEEPSLKVSVEGKERSIKVSLMGSVQSEILKRVIADRFGVDVSFDRGDVIYKETVTERVDGAGHYEPLRHYAEAHVMIEPLPRGAGIIYACDCPEDVLEFRWQRLAMSSLMSHRHLGVLTGSELTDVKITLTAGRAHVKHTEGGDFRQAVCRAVRQGLMKARCALLEPYYDFIIEVPSSCVGRAISDVRLMGGEFKAPVENDGMSVVTGKVPVKDADGYMETLASYTGGRGKLSLSPGGYGECRDAEKVAGALLYDPEADLENSPDSVFYSNGAGFVVKWDRADEYMYTGRRLERDEKAASRRRALSVSERELEEIMMREFGPIKRPKYSEPERVEAKERYRVAGVKTSLIIIDGYNVIFSWDSLREAADAGDLEGARASLLSTVANYSAFTGIKAVVVFDAYLVAGGAGEKYDDHGVEVVFTKENETGDAYIERLIYNIGKNEQVRVVTSDWLIQLGAVRSGVLRLSSAEFEREVEAVCERIALSLEAEAKRHGKDAGKPFPGEERQTADDEK